MVLAQTGIAVFPPLLARVDSVDAPYPLCYHFRAIRSGGRMVLWFGHLTLVNPKKFVNNNRGT